MRRAPARRHFSAMGGMPRTKAFLKRTCEIATRAVRSSIASMIRSTSAVRPSPPGEGTVTTRAPRRVASDSYTYRTEGNSPSIITILSRGGAYSRLESATAEATVTLGSIETLPGTAPRRGAISSPTVADMSHRESAQARTPRVAHVSAYSARALAAARGIAPREFEIRYTVFSRIGNSGRNRRRGSAAPDRSNPRAILLGGQKFFDRQAGGANQGPQGPAFDRVVVGHGERRQSAALDQDDMASPLTRNSPAQPHECLRHLSATPGRKAGQAGISTSRVSMVRGRPSSARTSRQSWMASLMLASASSSVSPWLTQPGIAGHSTT